MGLKKKWKKKNIVRPFLTQSDSPSRKRLFSTGIFFDWILLALPLIFSRVDFIVFLLFLEAVGVREYCCCMAVESRLAALLRAFFASNACFTREEPSFQRIGGVGLSRKPRSYIRDVALSRETPKLQQA